MVKMINRQMLTLENNNNGDDNNNSNNDNNNNTGNASNDDMTHLLVSSLEAETAKPFASGG